MTRIIFPEFRDAQSDSRYPFSDSATLLSNTGFFIPKDCFADANVYIINSETGTYLSSIVVDADLITISFSDTARRNICSTAYSPTTLGETKYNNLTLLDRYGRPAGILIGLNSGLKFLNSWPRGTHTFAPAATELVASVATPASEPGVRGLVEPSGELLTGDLLLIGDQGVVLRVLANNTIQVNIVGAPLFKRIQCLDESGNPISDFTPKNYLKTINGCAGDEFGNFTITIADLAGAGESDYKPILRIYPDGNGLKIAAVGSRVV